MFKKRLRTVAGTSVLLFLGAPLFGGNNKDYTYLALGDSVPFGMNTNLVEPPDAPPYPTADKFTGYPEIVAAREHLAQSKKEVNASCPGESSSSFLNPAALDVGCNSPHPLLINGVITRWVPPFKVLGLHTPYTGAQMEFAEAQLAENKHINLVTLNIGANDFLLVLPQLMACGANQTCAGNVLAPVIQTYAANLGQILTRIRAKYQGTLIVMTYYSPLPALDGLAVTINSVIMQVVAALNSQSNFAAISIADGFTAFQLASARFNHDACQAGLLIPSQPSPFNLTPCDIHPSLLGQQVLADTVTAAQAKK